MERIKADRLKNTSAIFTAVIDSHKGIIYKVANLYCRDEEDRKDLVQEIIFQLWRCFDRYDEKYRYSTWIYRIALNVAISFYRKEVKRRTLANPFTDELIHFTNEEHDRDATENIRVLKRFISELKELDRALILLYLEEKNHKEMADILGLTETNIATKISRIREQLKKKFVSFKQN